MRVWNWHQKWQHSGCGQRIRLGGCLGKGWVLLTPWSVSTLSQRSQGKEVYGWYISILFRLSADECSTWFPYLEGTTCRDGLQPPLRGLLGEQCCLCCSSPCHCSLNLGVVLRSKALMHIVALVFKSEEVSAVEYLVLLREHLLSGKTLLLVGAVALNGNVCANNWGVSRPIILQSLIFIWACFWEDNILFCH